MVWGITLTTRPCVKVRALAPGRVVVKYGLENIAVLEPPDPHIVAGNLQSCMKQITSSIAGTGGERPVLAAILLMIVDAVRRQGNGGTLIVGPHGQHDWIHEALRPKFLQAQTSPGLADELSERETAAKSRGGSEFEAAKEDPEIRAFLNGERVAETLWRKVSAIGQLSAVDGAVVVDDQLHLIDFGTKIVADEPRKYFEQEIEVEGETEKPIDAVGGTRHRSAAAFVDCRHDAVAFVASHDGPLSLFVYDTEKKAVVRWRHLERLID
jgi:hypothetical protein